MSAGIELGQIVRKGANPDALPACGLAHDVDLGEVFQRRAGGRERGGEPDTALIATPDGMPPAPVVERFDIRRGLHDQLRLALKNCCSILDFPTSAKYDGTIKRMAFPIGPTVQDAEAGLDALATLIGERLMTLQLPALAGGFDGAKAVRNKVEAAAAMRCAALDMASASI